MKLHIVKTEYGYEIADETNTLIGQLEDAFLTRAAAQLEIDRPDPEPWDEFAKMELLWD